jgi:flagellar biosynthesis/type III secretory pathway protein FliH
MSIIKAPLLAPDQLSLGKEVAVSLRHDTGASRREDLESIWHHEWTAGLEAKAQVELEAARGEGYRQGFQAGHDDGREAAVEAFSTKLALLDRLLSQTEQQLEDWLRSAKALAQDLTMEAFFRILGERVISPAVVAGLLDQLCAPLREGDVLKIRMHPTECGLLKSALDDSGQVSAARERLWTKIVEDHALQSGGLIVETPRGEYRASLDVLVTRLMQELEDQRTAVQARYPA